MELLLSLHTDQTDECHFLISTKYKNDSSIISSSTICEDRGIRDKTLLKLASP